MSEMPSTILTHRLAKLRTRIAAAKGAHMIVGAGCARGLSGGHIDASSIDSSIGAYLADKYAASGHSALAAHLNGARTSGGLSEVLRQISDAPTSFNEIECLLLCEDLETTLGSLEDIIPSKVVNRFKVEDF